MIQLRPYQQGIVDAVRKAYREGKRAPLVCLSTGGGKTTIFSYVTQGAVGKGRCVWLLCHRAELVRQIAGTLARFECDHQVIAPGPIIRQAQVDQFRQHGRTYIKPGSRAWVASVQTLVKRLADIPADQHPDIIVCDEAHHLTEVSMWGQIVAAFPKALLLPVTATPCRLDGKGLGQGCGGFADDIILGPSMRELIAGGYLSPYRIFAPPTALDLTGVRTRMGDFAKNELAQAMDKATITGDAVEHYRRHADGRRAIAFCVSVLHAEHVAAEFRQAGIAAEFLDGSLDAGERDARIRRFERGETLVLSSCDIVSEGFDLPAIEAAILLRPTKSLALYLQQVGRALRPFPGKPYAVILDHVGAVAAHGLPDEDREWTLDGVLRKPRKPNEATDDPPVTCPQCYAVHDPQPQCPVCGHQYPAPERAAPKADDGQLVEITAAEAEALRAARQKRMLQGKAKTLDQLVAQGISVGRAQKILAAREAKQALIGDVWDALEAHRLATGRGPLEAFGVALSGLRTMKPKALKELLARTQAARANDNEFAAAAA